MKPPGPEATRAEVEAYLDRVKTARAVERAANRGWRGAKRCSSCGATGGHRRGDRACPNYPTAWRWEARGAVYRENTKETDEHERADGA